ncbi:amidohydrolase family protein [Amycolatopsis sp. RM579]|uniref:Amidohydrolase family protein n=1 Tax=Amycolatopsis pithecellobii TaxID=664692 RepID=A0A6N7Z4I9_9PSEU|nr:amidohydrolase family protein [Amycolatopsis pithecellobii]
MIIDIHGHVSIPPEVLAYKAQLSASLGNPDVGPPKVSDDRLREFGQKHLNLLDNVGTDLQIISPRPFHAWHSQRPHKVVVDWTRHVNDIIARTCALFPDRYLGMGGLPQATGESLDTALAELDRCVDEYGFAGFLLNPDPSEGGAPVPPGLGDPYWYPLYEKLCERDLPVLVHSASCSAPRESYTLHFINEESIAIVSLLESPVFTDFPDLKIIMGHGGGAIPYQIARFESWRVKNKNPETFRDSMRRLWYDTCVYNAEGLDLLFKIVGTDRCMFGTELPGTGTEVDPVSGRVFDDLKPVIENQIPWLSDDDRAAVLENNARSLFKLPV